MPWTTDISEALKNWAPSLGVIALVAVALLIARRLLLGPRKGAEQQLPRLVTMFVLTLIGLVVIVISLPIESELRGQVLSLLGLVFTAVIALSSTTFVANAMGGLMLRIIRGFRPGDFIRVGEHFGRVTERGLFHTEIQTENRDLVTLPNLYVMNNPVTVVRSSGTVVSVSLSLGYDLPRDVIEESLLDAAKNAGLEDAFVHVKELGDFSITYLIAGFLADIDRLLTTRSRLRAAVLDALHGQGVEIVSPTFMNQRVLDPKAKIVPPQSHSKPKEEDEPIAEAVAFDKANRAGDIEGMRDELAEIDKRLGDDPTDDERATLGTRRKLLEASIDRGTENLTER